MSSSRSRIISFVEMSTSASPLIRAFLPLFKSDFIESYFAFREKGKEERSVVYQLPGFMCVTQNRLNHVTTISFDIR